MMADPLDALRALMASHYPPLDALVVPSEDNHQVATRPPSSSFSSLKSLSSCRVLIPYLLYIGCLFDRRVSMSPRGTKGVPSFPDLLVVLVSLFLSH
ncbi:hypothetical protein BHE74_00021380 [Ensete ventricosum]|nr:hypothetical protein GW17_00031252 [Ensete ventricosum]RWW70910.1 hypothetical protein BHE74_00021380 [Ensete ventricosum]RZR98392.1 hypothetical protein BHM03_00027739 [Ensete ventricosum]